MSNCIVCGSSSTAFFHGVENFKHEYFQVRGVLTEHYVPWDKCNDCGMIFTNPVPDTKKIFREAKGAYDFYKDMLDKNSELLSNYKYPAELLESWAKESGLEKTVIDMGMGPGILLGNLKKIGWKVYGIDIWPESVKFAKERFLDERECDTIACEDFATDMVFNFVVSMEALEHAYDPVKVLSTAYNILGDKGYIFIQTQLYVDDYKDIEDYLFQPGHISIFTFPVLERVMKQIGFKEIKEMKRKMPALISARRFNGVS